jgi:hypothetical protein
MTGVNDILINRLFLILFETIYTQAKCLKHLP